MPKTEVSTFRKVLPIVVYLIITIIFISQITMEKTNAISIEIAIIPYIIFAIIFFFQKIDGRWFILGTIISLLVAAVLLVMNNEDNANIAATHAYYFLAVGVLMQLAELIAKRKDDELYFLEIKLLNQPEKKPQNEYRYRK